MLKSMTGYGKCSEIVDNKHITVKIKTLNSKNFSAHFSLPGGYSGKEIDLRNMLYSHFLRGKIDFSLTIEDTQSDKLSINEELTKLYIEKFKRIAQDTGLNIDNQQIINTVLRLPHILTEVEEEPNEAEWEAVLSVIHKTVEQVLDFRQREGIAMQKDIENQVVGIENLLTEIKKYEAERIQNVRNRLHSKLQELTETDSERFEQEIIYFLDKFDINEEKIRLKNHCIYFKENMLQDSPSGNKLGFIAQEIGREINTIGSKANHADIQKIVVEMKDLLGKMKEQLLNVL